MIRWSDNDRRYGPVTVARGDFPRIGFAVTSSDDEGRDAYGRIHLWRTTILWPMPSGLIRPCREKVRARYWDAETIERMGRDWYWQVDRREYGVSIIDGVLHYNYGRQTHDSDTDCSGCYFLPWKEWRHVRHSFYDMDGDLFCHVSDDWDERRKQEVACPSIRFNFADFDGEVIEAKTRIEERQWKRGAGWCKWLSLVWPDKIRRSLNLEFSSEVGKRKGSWKGGTIGHSIDMLPSELHEAAFRRYCEQEGLTFIEVTA